MPLVHQTPISVKALNDNIDADLDMNLHNISEVAKLSTNHIGEATAGHHVVFDNVLSTMGYIDNTVDNDGVRVYGGIHDAAGNAVMVARGVGSTGHIQFYTPNAALNGILEALRLTGKTDNPALMCDHMAELTASHGIQFGAGTYLLINADNSAGVMAGGSAPNLHGQITLYGHDHATYPSRIDLRVANAAKASYVMVCHIDGATDTPELNMDDHKITNCPNVHSTGAYDGNGAQNRAIPHGLGRTPTMVLIHTAAELAGTTHCTYHLWSNDATLVGISAEGIAERGAVTAMDGTNFYVGDVNFYANISAGGAKHYHWIAFAE